MKKEKSRQNRFRCVMVPLIICCLFGILCGCSSGKTSADTSASVENSGQQTAKEWDKMSVTGTISLKYATQFQIDCYDDYRLITMATGEKYLVVPENQAVPSNLPEDIVVLQQPLDSYLSGGNFSNGSFSGFGQYGFHPSDGNGSFRMVHSGGEKGYGREEDFICWKIFCPGL